MIQIGFENYMVTVSIVYVAVILAVVTLVIVDKIIDKLTDAYKARKRRLRGC